MVAREGVGGTTVWHDALDLFTWYIEMSDKGFSFYCQKEGDSRQYMPILFHRYQKP